MPMPPPISSHRLRCSGVASRKRGNHANGMASSRPSASTTRSTSLVTAASTARGSTLTSKVLIPLLLKEPTMLGNQLTQLRELVTPEAIVPRQRHGIQPELGVALRMLNVNVCRLLSLAAEEEEPIAADPQDGRHCER